MRARQGSQMYTVGVFVMPIAPRAPRVSQICGAFAVVDNAGLAWSCCDQSPYDYLADEFVNDYRRDLDQAAIGLFDLDLEWAWLRRGSTVRFGTPAEVEAFPLDTATYHAVWNDAAALLDPDLIVSAAGLDDLRRIYS